MNIEIAALVTLLVGAMIFISYGLSKIPYWFTSLVLTVNTLLNLIHHANRGNAYWAIFGTAFLIVMSTITITLFKSRKKNTKNS